MDKVDPITEAVLWMLRRDDDGNVINPGLNDLESRLCLKVASEGHNCAIGEAIESAYKTQLSMELVKTIAAVAKKFGINQ